MNITRHILLPAASLFALLLGGCSKSPSPAPDDPQKGAIAFACTVSPEVAVVADGTKAGATRTLPASCLPAPEQMKLKLKLADPDKTFEMTYESMVDYDQPLLDPGSYTAGFSYGDPAEEGPDAAYFVGSTTCTIVARKTITQQVSHTLAIPNRATRTDTRWFRIQTPRRFSYGRTPNSTSAARPPRPTA